MSVTLCVSGSIFLYGVSINPYSFILANDDNAEIESLVKERNDARKAKDWARADAARDKLKAMHIELEDTPQGTVWHRV